MSLQISKKNGEFYLKGKLNIVTTRPFIVHFEYIIEQLSMHSVVINIDSLNHIDKDGFEAMKTLKAIALRNQKILYIIGDGCKEEVYDDFNQTDVA